MNSAPCRVLYLNHGAKLSGAELALRRLLGALDRGRVTPVVAFGEDGPMREAMLRAGVETHVLPLAESVREVRKDTLGFRTLLPGRRLAAAVAYAAQVARFARRQGVQLIHSNTIKAHLYGALAGRLSGLPVVWHLRDLMDESYFPASVVRGMRWGARHLPTHIIAVSGEVRDRLHLNGRGHRATVVHDGLGAEELTTTLGDGADDDDEAAAPGFSSPVRVGIVGRVARWKGQHVFLEAAAGVVRAGFDAEFQVVGAPLFGEAAYESELRAQTERLGLGGRVRFLGFRHDVPAVIRGLDVLVHASISGEPFGQVIIEGMAAGKPVIAAAGGGVPEIVTHGENGLLTPMGDAPALTAALLSLLADPARARRLGRAGRAHVRRHFTAEAGARRVEGIYRAVVGN